jgi:hypothetical protein
MCLVDHDLEFVWHAACVIIESATVVSGGPESETPPPDTVLEHSAVEIEQQTEGMTAEAKVGQELRFVNRVYGVHRLDLEDEIIVDNDIHLVMTVEFNAFVADWKPLATNERDSGKVQLMTQAGLVRTFQQPGAKVPVYLHGKTNDPPAERDVSIFVYDDSL